MVKVKFFCLEEDYVRIVFFLIILFITGIIFFVDKKNSHHIQAQEERPQVEEISRYTYRIVMPILTEEDLAIADILWFQKAAEIALEHKIPWFNVLQEQINQDQVEGIIRLERDPMMAEYDAHEILSLGKVEESK